MKVISLVTQKGGSGKSTICASLAVAAQKVGHHVCILEMDKQGTASKWSAARKSNAALPALEVAAVLSADKLAGIIDRLKAAEFDFVFIDTPGIDSPGTDAAIREADLCLIPCRPTPADLGGIRPTLFAINRMNKDFAFVLSQSPTKSYRNNDTAKGLKVFGDLANSNIVARFDHQDALGLGQGVTEFKEDGAAATEIRQLWSWVSIRINGGDADVAAA